MVTKPVVFKNACEHEVLAASCIILFNTALFSAYYLLSTFLLGLAFIIARITHDPLARVTLPDAFTWLM